MNQYPEPPRAVGGARSLMDTNPLVLFNVYSAGYQEEAAVAVLQALAKSRFTGDVSLLFLFATFLPSHPLKA